MIISIKGVMIASTAIASSNAFSPPSSTFRHHVGVKSSCSLHLQATPEHQELDVSRRQVLQQSFAAAASALLLPQLAIADTQALAQSAAPVVASASAVSTPVVEKKEILKADTTTTQPPGFTSTPTYEQEIVTADASGASSSTTTVSSTTTAVKEKEIVAILEPPPVPSVAVSSPPPAPTQLTRENYAVAIQKSTSALSTQLGHAFLVVDGLNSQARRLSASSHPAHGLAVLEGMNAQAKRLQNDLTGASALYKTIIEQAKLITVPEEDLQTTMAGVTRASSVLDGVVAQSKRLVTASGVAAGNAWTDDQIVYMLSVLDGLNSQVNRLNVKETFGLLDELNSKAEKMS